MYLVTTWFGSFLLDDGEVSAEKLFPKDKDEIAERLIKVEDYEALKEEKELAKGLDEFFVLEKRLEKRMGGTYSPMEVDLPKPEYYDFDKSLLRDAMIEVAKKRLRKAVGIDDHISQAIQTIDDLTHTSNLLNERLHEWYNLHFPELEKVVSGRKFAQLIAEHGNRESIPEVEFEGSVGAELTEEDKDTLMHFARLITDVDSEKEKLEKYIEANMKEFAPNVEHLAGPLIGAKLISMAGGLEDLAKMPSSTVQLLGAEKALFRHVKSGTKPPKHGMIFQHPYLHKAPYYQRGSIARAFAGKISIAARADFYSKNFIADELRKDLERAITDIRKKRKEPPPRKKGKRKK
ncbi:MAG: ribosomal biogenesis protein [Methanobacteriota archaeon]|nr:MAG: ribosomal biogenesis protein [Euryarchaeota archaeon]